MNFDSFFEPVYVGCTLNILRNSTKIELYSIKDEENDRVCSICQQNYIDGEFIRKILHCNHYYHQDCLDKWFENNIKCPECQYDIRTNHTLPQNSSENNNTEQQPRVTTTQNFATTIPLYSFVMPQTNLNESPSLNHILQNILNNINNGSRNVNISMNNSNNNSNNNTNNTTDENGNNENSNNENPNNVDSDNENEEDNSTTFIDIQYLTTNISQNQNQPRNDNSLYDQKIKELETDIKSIKLKLSEVDNKINKKRKLYREIYDSSDSDEEEYNYKIWNDEEYEDEDSNDTTSEYDSSDIESNEDDESDEESDEDNDEDNDDDECKKEEKNSIIKNVNRIIKYEKGSLSIWNYLVSLFK